MFLLGVDPGKYKTGVALVECQGNKINGESVRLAVLHTETFESEIRKFTFGAEIAQLILGDGTTSKAMREILCQLYPAAQLTLVNEKHSTEEARRLYYAMHPPKGLWRLVPQGLLVPSEPVDAYAALVLVRRYLSTNYSNGVHSQLIEISLCHLYPSL